MILWTPDHVRGRTGRFNSGVIIAGLADDVDIADDSDQGAREGFDDGDGTDAVVDHEIDDFGHVCFGVNGDDIALHEFADGAIKAGVFGGDGFQLGVHGEDEAAEVAIADHSDEFIALDNGEVADVEVQKHDPDIADRVGDVGALGIGGHEFGNFHFLLSFFRGIHHLKIIQ